jgi:hypothetical protein
MIATMRRILYWTLRPVWRVFLRVLPPQDPWRRLEYRVAVRHYGWGARHDFDWYFEGESGVEVSSIDAIRDWLVECEYVQDPELFHEPDFWQHPRTFERLRRGDCEDHAIWAWRKLVELGYDADLVSGRCLPWQPGVADRERSHVWVVFRRDGEAYLFEAAAKSKHRMVRPLAEAAAEYRPEFGVDRARQRFAFNGFFHTLREREFGVPDSTSVRGTA